MSQYGSGRYDRGQYSNVPGQAGGGSNSSQYSNECQQYPSAHGSGSSGGQYTYSASTRRVHVWPLPAARGREAGAGGGPMRHQPAVAAYQPYHQQSYHQPPVTSRYLAPVPEAGPSRSSSSSSSRAPPTRPTSTSSGNTTRRSVSIQNSASTASSNNTLRPVPVQSHASVTSGRFTVTTASSIPSTEKNASRWDSSKPSTRDSAKPGNTIPSSTKPSSGNEKAGSSSEAVPSQSTASSSGKQTTSGPQKPAESTPPNKPVDASQPSETSSGASKSKSSKAAASDTRLTRASASANKAPNTVTSNARPEAKVLAAAEVSSVATGVAQAASSKKSSTTSANDAFLQKVASANALSVRSAEKVAQRKVVPATPLGTAQDRVRAAITPAVGGRSYLVTPGVDYILTPDTALPATNPFTQSGYYYQNSEIQCHESATVEFKAGGGPYSGSRYYCNTFPQHVDKYVSGFLNSHKGGILMVGVTDNGIVTGMCATPCIRREMETTVCTHLRQFKPSVTSNYYHFSFKPVLDSRNRPLRDLCVALLEVNPLTSSADKTTIFESRDRKAYLKYDGSVKELTVAKIIEHVKSSYDKVLQERLSNRAP